MARLEDPSLIIGGVVVGATVPFDEIGGPGTYVCNWSGHLLRIPGDGLGAARHPPINLIGSEPLLVTKISENPYLGVNQARALAHTMDVRVDF
ncbi:MAG: hypothetical protein PVJ57_14285 [Phycisphaerae bacterium]|jgi:hypothetical protein